MMPENPDGSPAPDSFNFPWKGSVFAAFGAMLAVLLIFVIGPLVPVITYRGLVVLLGDWFPSLPAVLHAHKELVSATMEEVIYIFSFVTMLAFLKKITRATSIREVTKATFDKLRGNVGKLMLIGVGGWAAAMAINVVVRMALPMPTPDSPAGDFAQTLGGLSFAIFAFGATILAPICEELVFRGFIFNMLRSSLRRGWVGRLSLSVADWFAIVISAAFFAGMHMTPTGFPQLFVTGVVLAWVYRRTNNLYASMAVHFVNNSVATIALLLAMYH